ncbi:hypothetical protein SAMN05421871_109259 [Actinokineospora alba]|nr:hypothetical protein C8E96_2759 [Actinokineospora alba]SDJ03695.1 hypothetical protein SAMN05421871_109259 [Actinokineospora alba]
MGACQGGGLCLPVLRQPIPAGHSRYDRGLADVVVAVSR